MRDIPEEAVKAAKDLLYYANPNDVDRALTAALPFISVQGAVKKLAWTAAPNEAGRDGLWFIAIDLLGKKHEVIKSFNGQKGEGWTYGREWFPALEAAKAAAQADFEARILSALEPPAARELALEEEFATIRAMIYCYEGDSAQAFEAQKALAKIEDAIRALSSPDHADAEKAEADNAALTARVKELEGDLKSYQEPVINAENEKIDLQFKVIDLETKLAAAEEVAQLVIQAEEDKSGDPNFYILLMQTAYEKARAVLGGKPL